ncbi:FixH family protein [Ulvibacterium marinum]|uniref:Cytochrome C oxidase Cbb3 n=1 Tax=Ulvibacterium marinum TaxID=2419782 RepID=A0A3B0C5Y9_9FLAO|nr:FixH family protein [Ulvibacterium marinum]RKN79369.1 cytochrome C oxidase Cbb3 [Ulvibacterium marinum]
MKINWGTGIVLAFIGFIGFILFFVVRMSMDNKANHDLVTDEYYKQELAYQKEIDAEANAKNLVDPVKIEKTNNGLLLKFPKILEGQNIQGTVSLYRPSNKHLDFDLPVSLSNTHLLIPDKRLLGGRWDIKITWEHKGKEFLHKESITY